jgi:hypothetical protein
MIGELCNLMNCCKPNAVSDKLMLKSENLYGNTNENTDNNMNNNETQSRKNPKGEIVNKYTDSVITFSNLKVKENKHNKRVVDTLVIGAKEVILEGEMFFHKQIIIDKLGIKNEIRTERKGITIFGICDDINDQNTGIDFNLNLSKKKLKNKKDKNIPLFKIEYIKNDENYVLALVNKEIKMQLYIDSDFIIENNSNLDFMIGKIQITIKSPGNQKEDLFSVEVEGKIYQYNKFKDCPITIGRSNTHIIIKNSSISKTHAIIEYNEEHGTISIKDNGSTNGTYFILCNKYPYIYILSDLTMKLFESKFTIKLHEN